ncbi:MAG: potassium channel protein [Chloracidobacterium sp.]|nr:potassium channel protein [Chloracidobacterium sp.]
MKFLISQVSYFLDQRDSRRNIGALLKYLAFLLLVIALFTVLFHVIMLYVEGREFSWLSGLYWTLTVMTTLGFGDITFESDLGRGFSIVVLLSGVVLLLIMLPFTFIRFFYAPWLEAQIHARSPQEVPPDTEGHVIICTFDSIAPNLIKRLKQLDIPYFVIESDAAKAAEYLQDGISVIQGNVERVSMYRKIRVEKARLVFANAEDTVNTNIILTAREFAPQVPIAATAEVEDSIDILELSGATNVLPLKKILGEKLANRISVGKERANIIGTFNGWRVAEFTVHDTPYSGLQLSEANFREESGVNIIGVWDRGRLVPARPETQLSDNSVAVAVGTEDQIGLLNSKLDPGNSTRLEPVLIIGGGKVGRAAGQALKAQGVPVYMVEAKKELKGVIGTIPDRLTIGDAADRHVLEEGGLNECSVVILSTNQDAVNIYLSIYCRRLNPSVRIVSRITYSRNLEAVHRAGADFVLSYAPIGAETVLSIIQGRDSVILGEDVEFLTIRLPSKLAGKTLSESNIGNRCGLIVLAVEHNGETIVNPGPDHVFQPNCKLKVLGTAAQLRSFGECFL